MSAPDLDDLLLRLANAAACCRLMARSMEQEEDNAALYFLAFGLDQIRDDASELFDAAKANGPVAVT